MVAARTQNRFPPPVSATGFRHRFAATVFRIVRLHSADASVASAFPAGMIGASCWYAFWVAGTHSFPRVRFGLLLRIKAALSN